MRDVKAEKEAAVKYELIQKEIKKAKLEIENKKLVMRNRELQARLDTLEAHYRGYFITKRNFFGKTIEISEHGTAIRIVGTWIRDKKRAIDRIVWKMKVNRLEMESL